MRPLPRLVAVAVLALAAVPVPASAATDTAAFARWNTTTDFTKGTSVGLAALTGEVTLGKGTSVIAYDDPAVSGGALHYDRGHWTSPWQTTGFAAKSLIPSWSIDTPTGTWAKVEVRVRSGSTIGSWDGIARYASGTTYIKRSSYSSQSDDLAKVATDTVIANSGKSFSGWQVRVQLMRHVAAHESPTLKAVGGIAASYTTRTAGVSTTTMTETKDLAVPRSSQMIHIGEYPQWGGGGEAWCSPTSTSMVMRYFGKGPTPAAYAWSPYADGFVDHAARDTFDHAYDGTGNWPFNTAYSSRYALDSFVTRLHNLRDAEAFIKAGIPLVASIAFGKGELDGAPISSTPGHLLVIRGFTAGGRVIANDPAAASNSTVRRIYSRAQFERAWLEGSGGVVYVMRPTTRALPPDTPRW
ncbi:peptidase C39 family protein [Aeromicrobium ginsengisoli]|uniref:Peptidase C39 family protein n=1 Tax=Aeromicrobium ginsengisoli TaxID=363867 RepID=A0A5M4F9X2_9ACTN|nr:peptidase C39 family protein [Aeromicrobium ginsengisoli]KAA1395144.1 peptidase C39 family protein [Aeromicrobium ginsengisoli]